MKHLLLKAILKKIFSEKTIHQNLGSLNQEFLMKRVPLRAWNKSFFVFLIDFFTSFGA